MNQGVKHTAQTQYLYDSNTCLYRFAYAFFDGFVQDTNYAYDVNGNMSYDYDYFCGDMTASINYYKYDFVSMASHSASSRRTVTKLASSSWISDASGYVNQYLAYMPFGESFINQRSGNDIRFKFTGKERDSETGFDYFGARYYDNEISIWLSVDPLADKFPSLSSYAYVFNNPINFIDKWGLFGTKKEAKKFAKDNGVKTGWFRRYMIKKRNGRWNLVDKKNSNYTYSDNDGIHTSTRKYLIIGKRHSTKKNTGSSNGKFKKLLRMFLHGLGIYGTGLGENEYSPGSKGEYEETVDITNNPLKPDPIDLSKKKKEQIQSQGNKAKPQSYLLYKTKAEIPFIRKDSDTSGLYRVTYWDGSVKIIRLYYTKKRYEPVEINDFKK